MLDNQVEHFYTYQQHHNEVTPEIDTVNNNLKHQANLNNGYEGFYHTPPTFIGEPSPVKLEDLH